MSYVKDAGRILSMPSYRKHHIDLGEFVREGLDVLDNWSCVRHNATIMTGNPHPMHTDSGKSVVSPDKKTPTCEICLKSLREANRIPKNWPDSVPHKNWTMILFNHRGREIFVCGQCAAADSFRPDILDKLPADWLPLVAEDERDVFGVVETLFRHNSGETVIHRVRVAPYREHCANVGTEQKPKYVPQILDWHVEKLAGRKQNLETMLENAQKKSKEKKSK